MNSTYWILKLRFAISFYFEPSLVRSLLLDFSIFIPSVCIIFIRHIFNWHVNRLFRSLRSLHKETLNNVHSISLQILDINGQWPQWKIKIYWGSQKNYTNILCSRFQHTNARIHTHIHFRVHVIGPARKSRKFSISTIWRSKWHMSYYYSESINYIFTSFHFDFTWIFIKLWKPKRKKSKHPKCPPRIDYIMKFEIFQIFRYLSTVGVRWYYAHIFVKFSVVAFIFGLHTFFDFGRNDQKSEQADGMRTILPIENIYNIDMLSWSGAIASRCVLFEFVSLLLSVYML